MVIHNVYFWLQDGLSESDRQKFVDGVQSLLSIESVHGGYVGTPAGTEPRPIIDRSYDYALIVICETLADHDAYQVL